MTVAQRLRLGLVAILLRLFVPVVVTAVTSSWVGAPVRTWLGIAAAASSTSPTGGGGRGSTHRSHRLSWLSPADSPAVQGMLGLWRKLTVVNGVGLTVDFFLAVMAEVYAERLLDHILP